MLAAAEIEFAQRGSETSIADIARRAGVAKGTVFRHFATKEDLITAVVGAHFSRLTVAAQQRWDAQDPGTALWEFLAEAGESLQRQDVAFLQATGESDAAVAAVLVELRAAVEVLVDRARTHEAIRADVTGADVLMMLCAAVHTAGLQPDAPAGLWRRYLVIVIDGLSPAGATPLPELMPR
ncbi:TetR/AcrR family transcriptional regulator [Kineosporia sp. NBRC 101677]|uniref:TetR/AcrR family transcriptional regulator n=1 Tax=Kineosporia sp. NBRC 101677 TaxID=3032197 RepID=UPI002555E75D|nr:TetR/AcrR family transcriptional regulator [Kineosporia sp. NBRC 101677]